MKEVLRVFVDGLNKKGGVNGRNIELMIEDSKSNPKDGVSAAKKMLSVTENKLLFVFSHLSSISLAVAPIFENKNIPVVAVSASNKLLDEPMTVRNYITPERLAEFSCGEFSKEFNVKKFAVLYVNDDYGMSVKEAFKSQCKHKGVEVVFESSYNLSDKDFKSTIIKLNNVESKGVFVIGYGQPLGILIKQIKDSKYKGTIFTGPEITQPELVSFLGEYANSIFFPNLMFDVNKSLMSYEFKRDYKEKYNEEAFSASAIAFDGINVILHLFKKNDNINEALSQSFEMEGLNGLIRYENREIIYPFVLNKLENSKIKNNKE